MTLQCEDVVLSGGSGARITSARGGFLPVCLNRAPVGAFRDIPVYLKSSLHGRPAGFTLYAAAHAGFTEVHRARLVELGVRFVYVPVELQSRFHRQAEDLLESAAADPTLASSAKAEMIYETSVELANELLADTNLDKASPRLCAVSRAIATLVINDAAAFAQLFATSHHDFYTATHMINVGTWMVPLAYALGYRDPDQLAAVGTAGMLHDLGKVYVPETILNKKGRLSADEWATIRAHPARGAERITQCPDLDALVRTVVAQHHERLDGSGYPLGLQGQAIHAVSRMCAVVDAFDAMIALRPYKEHTLSVEEAMGELLKGTPGQYDAQVVAAWLHLMGLRPQDITPADAATKETLGRRCHERFPIRCGGQAHVLSAAGDQPGTWREEPGQAIVAHNISQGGLGFLSPKPVRLGEYLRIYLQGNGTLRQTLEGMVVRCRSYPDGWHDVGLRRVDITREEQGSPIDALP